MVTATLYVFAALLFKAEVKRENTRHNVQQIVHQSLAEESLSAS